MKKSLVVFLSGISIAALLAGGCANKEAVKKEEAVVPVVAAEKKVTPKQAEKAELGEQARLSEQVKPAQNEVMSSQSSNSAAKNVFETVYFDFDKSDLRQDSRDVLSKNAEIILKSMPKAKIQIAGHCDDRGAAEYNLALGEHRAKSVQKYLTTLGVNAENLSVISYGKEKPAVNGNSRVTPAPPAHAMPQR